ncbi:MAG: hypothetical protein GX802_04085 [Clostridiales bacterium]|jgi:hypothetical protein|nr:hypothetical protein [Clostridiales bacterium]
MIKIKNIKQSGDTISCEFAPALSRRYAYLKFNIETLETIELDYSEFHAKQYLYVAAVKFRILELCNSEKRLPRRAVAKLQDE